VTISFFLYIFNTLQSICIFRKKTYTCQWYNCRYRTFRVGKPHGARPQASDSNSVSLFEFRIFKYWNYSNFEFEFQQCIFPNSRMHSSSVLVPIKHIVVVPNYELCTIYLQQPLDRLSDLGLRL
jgi:hypothetical protein